MCGLFRILCKFLSYPSPEILFGGCLECKILFWCAGNVLGYVKAKYVIDGKIIDSFLAPAALNEVYGYCRKVFLVPTTLFTRDHVDNYRITLMAKACCDKYKPGREIKESPDPYVCRLIKDSVGYLVPHGGIGSALEVIVDEDVVNVDYKPVKQDYDFNVLFNTMYSAMCREVDDILEKYNGVEVHIDLTHGDNVMVLALMLASQIIAESRDINVKLFAAPILGRVEEGQEVCFLDVTESSDIARHILSGVSAWKRLDERLLPIKLVREIGRKIGREYGPVYSSVRSLVENSSDLLWKIRSGQIPVIHDQAAKLKDMVENAKNNLYKIISQNYLSGQVLGIKSDIPWVPVADTVTVRTSKLVNDIIGDKAIETTIKTLKLCGSSQVEYYDKVICIARELIVLLIARKLALSLGLSKLKPGRELWEKIDNTIGKIARGSWSEVDLSDLTLLLQLDLKLEELSVFERIRSMRNKLMHGMLSREAEAEVNPDTGEVDVTPISKRDISREVGKAIELIEKLYKKQR